MGFKSDILGLVGDAFDIVGDLKETTVVRVVSGTTYNPATSTVTETTTDTTVRAIWTKPKVRELDGIVSERENAKVLIPATDLTAAPVVNDQIVRADGTVWDVRETKGVPGESLYSLIVLKRG